MINFNPRSPHGERLHFHKIHRTKHQFQSTLPAWGATAEVRDRSAVPVISIHAPRMGSDVTSDFQSFNIFVFQSTLPAWGATSTSSGRRVRRTISIHAPRMGSDLLVATWPPSKPNFNPRSPHGERLDQPSQTLQSFKFQSTLPAWGATSCAYVARYVTKFQSTLPAWGATIRLPRMS